MEDRCVPSRALSLMGRRDKEIDKIALGISKINGTRAPRLRGRSLEPRLHERPQPHIFFVDIANPKLQDRTVILPRRCGARNVPFLRTSRKQPLFLDSWALTPYSGIFCE